MIVAVYGTLRKGFANYECCLKRFIDERDVVFMGEYKGSGFNMTDGTYFPYLHKAPKGVAVFELYKVERNSEEVLHVLDTLEGHPDFYKREVCAIGGWKAWVYLRQEDLPIVLSGDWKKHKGVA